MGVCLAQGMLLSACVQGPSKEQTKDTSSQDSSQNAEPLRDMSFMDAPTAAQRKEIQETAREYKRVLDEELKR